MQTKAHTLRTHPPESHQPAEVGVFGVAPLIFAPISQPQPSAAIPVDNEMLWVGCGWTNDGLDPNEPYHAADGSVIQFSAGLMYPSVGETIRHEMEHLAKGLEAWGSGLAGEDFERVDGMGGQYEG